MALSRYSCNFRVSVKFRSGMLQVDTVFSEHSPACMVKHGNRPIDKKPSIQPAKSRAAAARKTGTASALARQASGDSGDEVMTNGQTFDRQASVPSEVPDLFQEDAMSEDRQIESSQAAQRRANDEAARPGASQRSKKRARDSVSTHSGRRSRHAKAPPKPKDDCIYNSINHFLTDVKAYSQAKSPGADLRLSEISGGKGKHKKKGGKTAVLECSFPGCPFRVAGKTLEDARGRELEGFRIVTVS